MSAEKNIKGQSTKAEEHTIEIGGYSFKLKTANKQRLERAAVWLRGRLKQHLEQNPFLKPNEAYLLLLLELSFEREELQVEGKALLKHADQLLEWVEDNL